MALVNLKEILEIAESGCFAIPAFNVYNMETVMGVSNAAKKLKSPVIMQIYSRLFNSDNGKYTAAIIKRAAEDMRLPVALHLDHGTTEYEVIGAIRSGSTGVMIDSSSKPLDENMQMTKKIVQLCDLFGVPVEGELGHVGSTNDAFMSEFTQVDEAKIYVEETGISALAVLVGTAHGRYKKAPKLDIKRIAEIKKATNIPLVLHGGSGVPDDQIKAAIKAGIRKINFSTDLCYSFLDTIFETSREVVGIDLFMKEPIKSVEKFVETKIKLLGADGKA